MLAFCVFLPFCCCVVFLGLVSSVLSQEIVWEERLRNVLFCVEWDVKPRLNQSHTCPLAVVEIR